MNIDIDRFESFNFNELLSSFNGTQKNMDYQCKAAPSAVPVAG